jgi:hypothetical protein
MWPGHPRKHPIPKGRPTVTTTETPAPDIGLMERTYAAIVADPGSWNQETYRCESGMCFAGHAAVLAGASFPYPESSGQSHLVDTPSGERQMVWQFAQDALRLSEDQTEALFAGGNDLADIRAFIDAITAGADGNDLYTNRRIGVLE